MTANATQKTAIETYNARRADVARLLDVLEMELTKYDDRAKAQPRRWDFPGTMDYVRTTLIDGALRNAPRVAGVEFDALDGPKFDVHGVASVPESYL